MTIAYMIFFGGLMILGVIMLGTFILQCWVYREYGFPAARMPQIKPPPKVPIFEEWKGINRVKT